MNNLKTQFADMKASRVILIIIPDQSRGVAIMALASYLMAKRPNDVIICIQDLVQDEEVMYNYFWIIPNLFHISYIIQKSDSEVKDYNRGRKYLKDLAVRVGVKVYGNKDEALKAAMEAAKENRRMGWRKWFFYIYWIILAIIIIIIVK